MIRICKRISHAVQLLLHLANDAASRTQVHNDLCQEYGGYRQGYGRIEVHSFLLKRRERTLAARSAVLEMLEVKEDRRFGRLDDDSAKVKWMCVCVCFLPIYSGHQVRWTYQPGSHRRKVTQDF